MMPTPKEIIAYNREMCLDHSNMHRFAAIDDLKKLRSNPFMLIYWILECSYYDFRTRRLYDKLSIDPENWIFMDDKDFDSQSEKYRSWLDENEIKYHILWYRYHTEYGFVFDSKEDAMAFKLMWM